MLQLFLIINILEKLDGFVLISFINLHTKPTMISNVYTCILARGSDSTSFNASAASERSGFNSNA